MIQARCAWAEGSDAAMQHYHDTEWGVPQHDDTALFEFLTLEGAQAGLSWRTILARRDAYREAFHGFDIARVARMRDAALEKLLTDIRHHPQPAEGLVGARQRAGGTAHGRGAWQPERLPVVVRRRHADRQPLDREPGQVPATTPVSDRMSKQLRKDGFGFVGSTICYAFMQATGMVNDHLVGCFRHQAQ